MIEDLVISLYCKYAVHVQPAIPFNLQPVLKIGFINNCYVP